MLKLAAMKNAGASLDKQRGARDLGFLKRLLLRLLLGLMRVWSLSLRLRVTPESKHLMEGLRERPGIIVLWHNRLFMSLDLLYRYGLAGHTAALVSPSRDGAWMSAILEYFGIEPIRGSRNRRGRAALKELAAARRAGKSIFITPDGSKGPVYVMKPGAALLARQVQSEVYLLTYDFSQAWRLRTWDQLYVPYPFSKVEMRVQLVDAELMTATRSPRAATQILEQRLSALTEDADL